MTQPTIQTRQTQSALWNSRGGEVWVEQQELLDRLFLPFERLLADAVAVSHARDVLDIGCGAGATTLAAARRLGPQGRCTGLDISVPLINAARRRAEKDGLTNARFIADDAQRHVVEPGAFDAVISRFGVMFFDDPAAAFANLRRAVRPGADLTFIAWRSAEENPFMVAAERAAAPFLPEPAPRDPAPPGQFAFADADRVRRILEAEWRDIDIQPLDVPCTLSADDLATYAARMGRVGQLLPDLDEATRTRVIRAVNQAFEAFTSKGVASFTAACWRVHARAR
ncbi:class I SAM-dependent methyltransferase [Brevundimonas sp.]|uniref:class I SAM-dependent methyltransferase n=1 Tax=Brevundimonas sp. TaxID=1871086 RepID=UPI002ED8A781